MSDFVSVAEENFMSKVFLHIFIIGADKHLFVPEGKPREAEAAGAEPRCIHGGA